ncbi:WD40-repeat-containing domain protein [Scheffersomyces coipomensis]|uniref:WD40-repeat-containing domain protein n=1 Tax=Scheffersomyces coipomensis TaxID=1788519 RepID=UPI00315D3058
MVKDGIKQEAIFIGANRQSFVVDYNKSENLVAYGAGNTIALWNPLAENHIGVESTLKKHTKEVTGVRFIPNSPYIVSSGEDNEVNVWKKSENSYKLHESLSGHEHSITCLSVINEKIFVTGGADGNIILWVYNSEEQSFKLSHKFQVKFNFFPLTLALQDIDTNGNYILAVGGTTSNLYIYSFTLLQNGTIDHFNQSALLTGHEDWIKCLQFVADIEHKSYILASGSQDRYIRLWRLKLNELIDDSDEDEMKLILLSNKQYKFNIGEHDRGAISFEALLVGHDDWVTGLQWHPSYKTDGVTGEKRLQLLSSSADTALMVWEMDVESGIWVCVNRLGELSIKGASTATGASGGFWSCLWFVDDKTGSQYILSNGKTGSIRVYRSTDSEAKTFESTLGVTGAVKEVTGLTWSLNGEYFTSVSLDQTARLFAPWTANREFKSWHEFARPQIHGYDMICIDNVTNTKFVSGGDEKILRVFEITNSIYKLLKNLCNIDVVPQDQVESLPEAASLPVLGLSNKADNEQQEVGQAAQEQQDADEDKEATPVEKEDILASLTGPPLEDYLQRYTLFPELEKLYGHGYEITCCATSPNGLLIASACRSNSSKHAVIRIFNVGKDFQQSPQVLEGHNLTITSLEFSPDGQYLLAVSRDRQFSLWRVSNEAEGQFELVELNTKASSRILWDCSWLPINQFGSFFLTASRDKTVKLWQVNDTKVESISVAKVDEPVISVSCYRANLIDNFAVISFGLENGNISVYKIDLSTTEKDFQLVAKFDTTITPDERISKLSFSSKLHEKDSQFLLAVASKDTSTRLYSIAKDSVI